MIEKIKSYLKLKKSNEDLIKISDEIKLLNGKILTEIFKEKNYSNINDYEFKIFSQFGEDGIIQYLIKNLNINNKKFIEFGVENYSEANTRFLLQNDNWSGLILDSSNQNINFIKKQDYYWKYDVRAVHKFLSPENINEVIKSENFEGNIGLLSIDIDGNDYWILKAINVVKPDILIVEYNANFGSEKSVTIKYDKNFKRAKNGIEKLIYGCSLKALNNLCSDKGYSLVCSNKNGNNAFFVKNDLLNDKIKTIDIDEAFKKNSFNENFDHSGYPNKISIDDHQKILSSKNIVQI